jgi:pyroglutamyl-peptidase
MTRATKRPVLLTGFDPFDGAASNPSWQAVDTLSGRTIAGHAIETRELPTEFRTSLRELRAAIARTEPSLVICVGLAGGRAKIGLERVAINVDDARIAGNARARP